MVARGPGSLTETYLELRADGKVQPIPLTPDFWPDVIAGKRSLGGRLIMASPLAEDMNHWERHPAGDEILLLLSGRAIVVLEAQAAEDDEEIAMAAGEAYIVPRGRWHRVKAVEPGEMVFMTPGAGTTHKPL